MKTRLAVLLGALGLAATTGVIASAFAARSRTVPCSESIVTTRFPYLGALRREDRYRLVLGAVSVPEAYHRQIVPTGDHPWAYFRKAGLVVRASGQSVVVSVPEHWRDSAAIAWGYGGHGVFSTLRIAGCKAGGVGFAYSGGFYLRKRAACLPLIVRVGRRSATVRFGLGRRCGS